MSFLLCKHTQHKHHPKQTTPEWIQAGWDIGERQEMVTLKGHADIVMGMIVMKSLDNLVSASLDTSIRVWDTYTQKPVHTLLGHNKVRENVGAGMRAGRTGRGWRGVYDAAKWVQFFTASNVDKNACR